MSRLPFANPSPHLAADAVRCRRPANGSAGLLPRVGLAGVVQAVHLIAGMHAPPTQPKTVLIADDDAWTREMLVTLLAQEGLRPLEAATGTEAVHVARQHHPDLIVLDVAMPGRSGLQALEALRTRDSTRDIPVVLVSGEINLVQSGHAYDADAAFHKPLDFGAFLAKIQETTGP